jgi:polysaccharide pyruvyl transferase WcaK-like protein
MNSDSKSVYLCGAGGKGNIGAEAITLAIIKLFQRRYRHVHFLVSAWYPNRMRELLSRVPGDFAFVKQESLLDNPLHIARSDFFVICGDVSISETVVSFLPLYYALRTATANAVGRKVLFLGIEAEKIGRLSNRYSLKWLVDRPSNTLALRNEESLANLNRIPIRRARLLLGCEPTLSLEKDDVQGFEYEGGHFSPSKLRVGFGIRDHFTQPFKVNLLRGKLTRRDVQTQEAGDVMRRITEFTAQIADHMAEMYDAQIIFVPHHYLPEGERVIRPDSEVAQMMIERMQVAKEVVIVEDCLHPFTVVNLYRDLDMVFSMRHHSNSFGYLNHVPTFGYDIYPKIRAFFKQIGREDMLLDPFATDLSETYEKIDRVVRNRQSISSELKTGLDFLRGQNAAAMEIALNGRS